MKAANSAGKRTRWRQRLRRMLAPMAGRGACSCGHLPPISRADRTQLAAGDQFRLVLPPTWNASLCPLANTGRIDAKATSNLGL